MQVGPYVIERELARGGQGLVFRARDARSGHPAAVKLLVDAHDEVAVRRFEREARLLEALAHPSLVRVLEHGVDRGRPYLAMELVEGVDLARRLATGGPPPPAWTARTLAAVARALEVCHARGVVHRDVKPQNVLLEQGTERPVLVDLGLVRRDPARTSLDGASVRLTASGEVMGTPSFMPPEQADGGGAFGPVGPPADVYALGATLYTLLTGRPPFDGPNVVAVLAQVLEREPAPPRSVAPDVPPELDALCLRALKKQPADRPSAAELARALEAFAAGPRRARRRAARPRAALLAAGAAVAVMALVGGLVARRSSPPAAPAARPSSAPTSSTPSPGPTDRGAPPWPALPAGARVAWRLGQEPPPTPDAPALWLDEVTAAPLERVAAGDPQALAAAFDGRATARDDGRVAVRYDASSVRLELTTHKLLAAAAADAPVAAGPDGELHLRSANDGGYAWVHLGGPWRAPAVSLSMREVTVVDFRQLRIIFNAGEDALGLAATGRTGRLQLDGLPLAWIPLAPGPSPTHLRFAPWAPRGQRVLVDGVAVEPLDLLPGRTLPSGDVAVRLGLAEVDLLVRDLEVEGAPLRIERPALARPPAAPGASARIAGAFEREASSAAGPMLALGEASVELAGARLVLRSGDDVLGVAALPTPVDASGWLVLERSPGLLRAEVEVAGARAALVAADPLGEPDDGEPGDAAGFGSTGPRVRWLDVELGVADPPTPSLEAWRAGARALARLTSPRRPDPRLVGLTPQRRLDRTLAARLAAAQLAGAGVDDLPDDLRHDARARAVLAWVLAGDVERAGEALDALEAEPGAAAGPLVDGLLRGADGRPLTLEWLADGWLPADRAEDALRAAALEVAWRLAPERRARIARERGLGAASAASALAGPARRRGFEEALREYDLALREGAAPVEVAVGRAEALMELGRNDEALAMWDLAVQEPTATAWSWHQRARTLAALGRLDAGIESALGALARGQTLPYVRSGLRSLATRRAEPTATALLALHLLDPGASGVEQAARGLEPTSARDQDVLAYLLGQPPPPGDRPTRLLALARLGDAGARQALAAAGAADPLVLIVVLLDPSLRDP